MPRNQREAPRIPSMIPRCSPVEHPLFRDLLGRWTQNFHLSTILMTVLLIPCIGLTLGCQPLVDKLNARFAPPTTLPEINAALDSRPLDVELLLRRAALLWNGKDWAGARADLTTALESGKLNAGSERYNWALETRAHAALNLSLFQEAIRDFSALVEQNPDNSDWLLARAEAYSEVKDFRKALEDIERALATTSSPTDALLDKAEVLGSLGERQLAKEAFRLAIEKSPTKSSYLRFLSFLEQSDDHDEAISVAGAALSQFPALSPAYCIKAQALFDQALVQEALTTIELGLSNSVAPGAGCLYFQRALLRHLEYSRTKDRKYLEQVFIDYSVALNEGSIQSATYWNRCLVAYELEHYRVAIDDCRRAAAFADSKEGNGQFLATIFSKARTEPEFLREEAYFLSALGYLGDRTENLATDVEQGIRRAQLAYGLSPTGTLDAEIDRLLLKELEERGILRKQSPRNSKTIAILYPPGQTHETDLGSIQVQLQSELPESLEVTVNGQVLKPKSLQTETLGASGLFTLAVPLALGQNSIGFLAKGPDGNTRTAKLLVTRRPSTSATEGKRWAVVVGAGTFSDSMVAELPFAERDASEVATFLISKAGYSAANVYLLGDSTQSPVPDVNYRLATYENVRRVLFGEIRTSLRKEDTLFFYFSGHGILVPDSTAEGGLAAVLAPIDFEVEVPALRGLMLADVKRLAWLPPERVFVVLDACFSGEGRGVKSLTGRLALRSKGGGASLTGGFAALGTGKGRVLLSSSQDDQPSWESKQLRHGVFTYYLLKSLNSGDRRLADIFKAVHSDVVSETQGQQEPRLDAEDQRGDLLLY